MVCPLRVGLAAVSAFIAAFLIYISWDAAHRQRPVSRSPDEQHKEQARVGLAGLHGQPQFVTQLNWLLCRTANGQS